MIPLAEYAVVDEDATVLDALQALDAAQRNLPPDRHPHRAILVRDETGRIVGKLHHFAFLRALLPDRKARGAQALLDRAGVDDDLRDSSWYNLDLLTADMVNICERARSVKVGEVSTAAAVSIDENARLAEAIPVFLAHQTLSLLVTRRGRTVGVLRLSDFFDELARQIMGGECPDESEA
jgi:CBS domain-containing protein